MTFFNVKNAHFYNLKNVYKSLFCNCGLMSAGYQRELGYRHSDGSYSAFGESDNEGSLWLTSFVVRSFARAQPFIYIDPAHLTASIDWIRAQQLENGCFRPVRFTSVCGVSVIIIVNV